MTTGVALTAAGVVVANPIVAPRSDIQIPSVALSAGTGDAISMLDQAFLDAIAPAPPESTSPFSVLRQLVSSLAADASYMGKNAIVDAFVAGVTAVSEPELTATSTPYFTPLAQSPELAMSILPGLDLTSITPVSDAAQALPGFVSAVTGTVAPAVKSFVGTLIHDAAYVGGELVAAAFATGAMVANEPRLIGETLKALVNGDFSGALRYAVKAVTAPLGPPIIIVNAVATLIEKYLGDLSAVLPLTLPQAPTPAPDSAGVAPDVEPTPVAVPETGEQARAPRGAAPVVPLETDTDAPRPAAALSAVALSAADSRLEATETQATETQATETQATDAATTEATEAADKTTVAPRAAARSASDAVKAAGEQIGSAVSAAADSVGKASTRARGGKPGPARN